MIRNSSYDVKIICCLMGTSMTIFFPVSYSLIQVYFSLHISVFYSSDFTRSKRKRKRKLVLLFFFFLTQGVRASLCAPQLIPGPIKHPPSPINK